VQCACIPQVVMGNDVICQAKSGMGKTAVFVLGVLQQIDPASSAAQAVVLCHTRELAYQICREFGRFGRYLPDVRAAVFYGGVPVSVNKTLLKNQRPQIAVGTPAGLKQLVREGDRDCSGWRHFILDEADKMLAYAGAEDSFGWLTAAPFSHSPPFFPPQTCEATCRRSTRQRRGTSR